MKVLLSRGGDDMIMVGHENNVMDKKVIFFMGFLECLEEYSGDLALIEPERSIIGPADQVVGQLCLNDSQRTSHAVVLAKSLPKCSDTGT